MNIAVITGASSGIGKELTIAIDKEYTYDEIWLISRREEVLRKISEGFRNEVRIIQLDLLSTDEYSKYQALLTELNPEISLLVNCAGAGTFGPFEKCELKAMMDSTELNTKALMAFCHMSIPYMKKGSGIINFGSNSSWQPVPYQAVYGATKAYVLSLSRAIGRELRSSGIHVMCVCPGWIKTEFQDKAGTADCMKYIDKWYQPEEVAAQTIKDYKRKRKISILGAPVRNQVRLVKFLPVDLVMNIWCKQQDIK